MSDCNSSTNEDTIESTEWKLNDKRALPILSTTLSPNFQKTVRAKVGAKHLWDTLQQFFVRKCVQNKVQIRRKLHEFEMFKEQKLVDGLMNLEVFV